MGPRPEEAGLLLRLYQTCTVRTWGGSRGPGPRPGSTDTQGVGGSSLRQLASQGEFGWGQARGGAGELVPGQCQGIWAPAATHCIGTRDSVWPGINDPFLRDWAHLQGRLAPTLVLHPAYLGAQLQAACT